MPKYLDVMNQVILDYKISGLELINIIKKYERKKIYALYSGGKDSVVLADWAWKNGLIDGVKAINTTIHCTGWIEFVNKAAQDKGWNFEILSREDGKTYEWFVLNSKPLDGFPHSGVHSIIMRELKMRPLIDYTRKHKNDKICWLTGVRLEESTRRFGNVTPITVDSILWLGAPIYEWTSKQIYDYIKDNNLPIAPLNEEFHIPMDCGCGSFAQLGEAEVLAQADPTLSKRIATLEKECVKKNKKYCTWGNNSGMRSALTQEDILESLICHGCQHGSDI